jgi:aryl-alcohol dehydrogenase-like predicted oxidoreductase
MKYRRLGRTRIEVSELVFGCGNVGGLLIRGAPDDMRAAFRRALDAGINWFDTATASPSNRSAGCWRRSTRRPTSRPSSGSTSRASTMHPARSSA